MKFPPAGLPRISVVVPSLNQGRFLRQCLESIFNQQYPALEVIVMDGGSTDDSVDILRAYADRLAYWQSGPDGGQSAAINAGVARSTGTLVAWLNSDDYYWDDCLWTVGRAWADLPGRGLYIGNGFRQNERSGRRDPFTHRHVALNREALRQGLDYILQPATFFFRDAWQVVGGVSPDLHYCMDWDLILRIAARYPAVLINEFLAVSREYEATKTGSGGFRRVAEIARMIASHTGDEGTPGIAMYALATLLDGRPDEAMTPLRHHLGGAMGAIAAQFRERFGHSDGFPLHSDPQDRTFVPLGPSCRTPSHRLPRPSCSVVITARNQAEQLTGAIDSLLGQDCPGLELIVVDRASDARTREVLRNYDSRLTLIQSVPDAGPAAAINGGLRAATGEVLAWLDASDWLATNALTVVAEAFANDPDLDLLVGNTLFVDESNQPRVIGEGDNRTAWERGNPHVELTTPWQHLPVVPRGICFRRRVLDAVGLLNEELRYAYGLEFLNRACTRARCRHRERTLVVRQSDPVRERDGLRRELYRLSRRHWPRFPSVDFWKIWRGSLAGAMRRRQPAGPRGLRYWTQTAYVGLSMLTGIGNAEQC